MLGTCCICHQIQTFSCRNPKDVVGLYFIISSVLLVTCVICVDQKPPSQLNRPYSVPLTWCASIPSQKPRDWAPREVSCRDFAVLLPLWTCVSCCFCQISLMIWADTRDNIPAGVLVNTPQLNKSTVAQINYLYALFGNCCKMKLGVS